MANRDKLVFVVDSETKSATKALGRLDDAIKDVGKSADKSESQLEELTREADRAASAQTQASKEQKKAAKEKLKAEENLAEVMRKNKGLQTEVAREERRNARESVKLARQVAKEKVAASKEAAAAAKKASLAAREASPEYQNASAFRSLSVGRDSSIEQEIKEIETLRDRAVKSADTTANERIRIEAAASRRISRLRSQLDAETLNGTKTFLRQVGVRREQSIRDEIADLKRREKLALASAKNSAADRLNIERATAAQIRALNTQLSAATASSFARRFQGAREAVGRATEVGERVSSAGMSYGMGVALPVGYGVGFALKSAAQFEARMNGVRAIMQDLTDEEFTALEEKAKELGKTTVFTANEVAQGIEILAANGLSAKDILGGALEASMSTTSATGGDLGNIADLITDVMLQFGKKSSELKDVGDYLTGVRNSSKMSPEDISYAFGMGGGVAGISGMSFEDYGDAIASVAFNHTSGSDLGTSLKTFVMRLSSPDAAKARDAYGFKGYSVSEEVKAAQDRAVKVQAPLMALVDEAKENIERVKAQYKGKRSEEATAARDAAKSRLEKAEKNLVDATEENKKLIEAAKQATLSETGTMFSLEELADELRRISKGKTQEEKNAMFGDIFGQDAVRTAMALAEIGSEGVREQRAKVQKGDAKTSSEIRLEGLIGDLKLLSSATEGLALAFAQAGLIEDVTNFVQKITEFVSKMSETNPELLKFISYFSVLMVALAPVLIIFGKVIIALGVIRGALISLGINGIWLSNQLNRLRGAFALIRALILGIPGVLVRVAASFVAFFAGIAASPALVTAAIVAALVAVGVLVYKYRDEIWEAMKSVWSAVGGFITDTFSSVFAWIISKIEAIKSILPTKESFSDAKDGMVLTKGIKYIGSKFADGGIDIRGPGSSRSDSIPAWLSNGESVINAKATSFWGTDLLKGINNMNPAAVLAPVMAPVVAQSVPGDLRPFIININGQGAVDGLYGTSSAVRQLEKYAQSKSGLRPVSKSRQDK